MRSPWYSANFHLILRVVHHPELFTSTVEVQIVGVPGLILLLTHETPFLISSDRRYAALLARLQSIACVSAGKASTLRHLQRPSGCHPSRVPPDIRCYNSSLAEVGGLTSAPR